MEIRDVWSSAGSAELGTDVGYTGQRLDATGLMYYNARYYDPVLRRFAQADTIVPNPADPQDFNRFTYVRNNPTKYSDPTGHCASYSSAGCEWFGNGWYWDPAINDVRWHRNEPIASVPNDYSPKQAGRSAAHAAWDFSLGIPLDGFVGAMGLGINATLGSFNAILFMNAGIGGYPVPDPQRIDVPQLTLGPVPGYEPEYWIAGIGAMIITGFLNKSLLGRRGVTSVATNTAGRPLWGFWDDYPKVAVNGTEYANVGGRLYTQHAVERMTPSGFGTAARPGGVAGRSISPTYVDEVLTSDLTVVKPVTGPSGQPRLSYVNGSVEVITENDIVVTIITR